MAAERKGPPDLSTDGPLLLKSAGAEKRPRTDSFAYPWNMCATWPMWVAIVIIS